MPEQAPPVSGVDVALVRGADRRVAHACDLLELTRGRVEEWASIADPASEPQSPIERHETSYARPILRRRLEDAGIETNDTDEIGGRPRFFCRDPFGNRVELTEWRAASLDAADVAFAAPRLLSVSTTRTGCVGARFWGHVRGLSGRLRVLQGRGAGSGKTGRIAGKAR